MSRGKNAARWAVLAVFLAACLYIAWKVPYTHDDWDWGLPVGVERLVTAGLNSRYGGTALVLAMTRSQLMKTLVMGAGMFLVPWLAARLTTEDAGERTVWTAAGGAALFSMPMVSWQQTFGWVSAFANFVAGAAVMLGVLLLWQKTFSKKSEHPLPLAGALFVLCLAGQLFAENQTLALTGAGVVTGVYALASRRGQLPALAGLAGCALGALLMFGNPLYGQLAASGTAVEGVRSLVFEPGQGLASMAAAVAERLLTVVLPGLFEYYPGVCLLVSVGCLWRLHRRGVRWYWQVLLGLWSALYCVQCWVVMEHIRQLDSWQCPWQPLRVAGAVIQLILLLAVVVWEGGEAKCPIAAALGGSWDAGPLCSGEGLRRPVRLPLGGGAAGAGAVSGQGHGDQALGSGPCPCHAGTQCGLPRPGLPSDRPGGVDPPEPDGPGGGQRRLQCDAAHRGVGFKLLLGPQPSVPSTGRLFPGLLPPAGGYGAYFPASRLGGAVAPDLGTDAPGRPAFFLSGREFKMISSL